MLNEICAMSSLNLVVGTATYTSVDTGNTWLNILITFGVLLAESIIIPVIVALIKKKFPSLASKVEETSKDIIEDLKDDGKLNGSNKKEDTKDSESEDKE